VHPLQQFARYDSFECQLVTVNIGTMDRITVAAIYRPPSSSLPSFYDDLSDLFTKVGDDIDADRFVACGDFSCAGVDPNSVRMDLTTLFDMHGLHQHVPTSTRSTLSTNSLLDLVISRAGSGQVLNVDVQPTHAFSDHDLVTWSISTKTRPPRLLQSYSVRNVKSMNLTQFQEDLRCSKLFTAPEESADGFAHQLESVVLDVLDKYCPLQTRTKFASTRRDCRRLSAVAVQAKRNRRRLERQWRTTRRLLRCISEGLPCCQQGYATHRLHA
jgi:hypothetical protein